MPDAPVLVPLIAADQWSFYHPVSGTTDLSNIATSVMSLDGIADMPPIRGQDLIVPSRAGRLSVPKSWDGRSITLILFISPRSAYTPALAAPSRAMAQANLDLIQKMAGCLGVGQLTHTMPDGSARVAAAEVVGLHGTHWTGESLVTSVDFYLADPWFYGPAQTITQALSAYLSHTLAASNSGSVRTARITADWTGPVSNPKITTPSGIECQVLVAVPATKHLILDSYDATAYLDGVSCIGSVRHAGANEFLALNPGESAGTVNVDTNGAGASLDLTIIPPFV
jgi:hypothetical protein